MAASLGVHEAIGLCERRAEMAWRALRAKLVPLSSGPLVHGIVPRASSGRRQDPTRAHQARGDGYQRSLLAQGATSAVPTAHERTDRRWQMALRERSGGQNTAVAKRPIKWPQSLLIRKRPSLALPRSSH
jgi:hypothetical protein